MKNIYIHLLLWILFITYEMSYLALAGLKISNLQDYAVHYALNISLFYLNAAAFEFIFNTSINKYLGIPVILLAEIIAYLLAQYLIYAIFYFIHTQGQWESLPLIKQVVMNIYRALYFIGFSIGYWFAASMLKQRKQIFELENKQLQENIQKIELENKLMQAKNSYLKSQLSPHLLFNTLNFIYNSVRQISTSAAKAVLLLSDMMRYSLSDTGADGKVSLQEEVDHIRNFVRLNQLRFNEKLNVQLSVNGSFDNQKIIPLVLISFVENMYKHGNITDAGEAAQIWLECKNDALTLRCMNKKGRSTITSRWGIGVDNARSRLQSYYPDKFILDIKDTADRYSVLLAIDL